MILINPLSGTNKNYINVGNVYDYDINYTFATMLSTALSAKGEACILSRNSSVYPSDSVYALLLNNNSFDVIINVKCLYDIGSDVSGFSIECDKYNALVATISDEFVKVGSTCIYPKGYKTVVTASRSTAAKYTEITVGLGFLSNADDLVNLVSNTWLETLAKNIVAAAYAAPIRNTQPSDAILIADPYFYGEGAWYVDETTAIETDDASIQDVTIDDVPAKVLNLKTSASERTFDYTWLTEVSTDAYGVACTITLSYRFKSATSSLSVTLGETTTPYAFLDYRWHTVTFNGVPNSIDKYVKLSIPSSSDVDITAVWPAKASIIGSIDDPVSDYSIYPPAYQKVTETDLAKLAASNTSISTANSLLSRAQDTTTSLASTLQDAFSKIDQIVLSPSSLASSMGSILSMLQKTNLASVSKLNPGSLKVDYEVLETAIASVNRADKKASMLNAVNTIKGVETAINTYSKTLADKKSAADKKAAAIRARTEAKGEAMSQV